MTLLRVGSPAEAAVAVMSNHHLCCPRLCCFQHSQTWLPCAVWIHISLRATCLLPWTSGWAHAGGLGQMKLFQPQTHSSSTHKDPSSRGNLYICSLVSSVLPRMLWSDLSVHENQTCFSFREKRLLSFPDTVASEDVLCYQSSCYHLTQIRARCCTSDLVFGDINPKWHNAQLSVHSRLKSKGSCRRCTFPVTFSSCWLESARIRHWKTFIWEAVFLPCIIFSSSFSCATASPFTMSLTHASSSFPGYNCLFSSHCCGRDFNIHMKTFRYLPSTSVFLPQ